MMLSLPRYTLLLILWVSLFFNIERFQVDRNDLISISSPIYILFTALVVVGLLLPQWRPTSVVAVSLLALVSFGAIKLLDGRPDWGQALTFLTLFELTGILVAVALAHRVGQLIADMIETVRALLLSDLDGRVHPSAEAEAIVKREMQHARRRNLPLSLLLVEADTKEAKVELSATAKEINALLTQRLCLVTTTRLLASTLRRSDLIVDETDRGRWLLMTSEVQRGQASTILQRLDDQTKKPLGIKLKYGIASFPEHGLTFEDLLAKAEQDLRAGQAGQPGQTPLDPNRVAPEEPSVRYSSIESTTK